MIRSITLAKWAIPQRYCKLELYKGRALLTKTNILSKLDANYKISFTTSETVSGAVNETNVEISGLKPETMLYLSTSFTEWLENSPRNEIVIDAGYDSLHGVIFKGDVIEAIPNLDQADYSIKLKCMSYYDKMNNEQFSFSFPGSVPATVIAQAFAAQLGFGFFSDVETDIFVDNYNYINKNIIQHLRNLANISGLDVYISQNMVFIKTRGKPLKRFPVLKLGYKDFIGSPEPTPLGCNVRIKLNPSIATGQRVFVKSLKFTTLESVGYVVQSYSHSGDTKGSKWQTNVTLIREDFYNADRKKRA